MPGRFVFFALHSVVHVVGYVVPRALYLVLVYPPLYLARRVGMLRRCKRDHASERDIAVLASPAPSATRLRCKLGLDRPLRYDGPMYSGHIHTILGAMRPARRVAYTRATLAADDGNPICLDWLRVPRDAAAVSKALGVLLVVPGIGNYGQTPYVQRLARATVAQGFDCCVLTPRGMGSAPLQTPRTTCIAFTSDVKKILKTYFTAAHLRHEYGKELPLMLVGYSAGGNTLVKALAELQGELGEGTSNEDGGLSAVSCCVCMNPPYDLFYSMGSIESWMGRVVYQGAMLTALRKYAKKHASVIMKGLQQLDIGDSFDAFQTKLKTLHDFNIYIVAPLFGYASVDAYYADCAMLQYLKQVRDVPVVCVSAADDPMAGPPLSETEWQELVRSRPNVIYVETAVGGHLAYLRGPLDELAERTSFLYGFPLHVIGQLARGVKSA